MDDCHFCEDDDQRRCLLSSIKDHPHRLDHYWPRHTYSNGDDSPKENYTVIVMMIIGMKIGKRIVIYEVKRNWNLRIGIRCRASLLLLLLVLLLLLLLLSLTLEGESESNLRSGFGIYEVESAGYSYCCCSRGVNFIKMERVSRAFEEYAICILYRCYWWYGTTNGEYVLST